MNNNRCVSCNEIIPEGRLMCPSCENVKKKERLNARQFNEKKMKITNTITHFIKKIKGEENYD